MQATIAATKVASVMIGSNLGVDMLLGRRYQEAIETLTNVLEQVKILWKNCNAGDSVLASNQLMQEMSPFCGFLCTSDEQSNSDNDIFLFRSPIVVNVAGEHATRAPPQTLLKLTFVLVYNLALSYHLNALTTKTCKTTLCKAMGYYAKAHGLQPSNDTELSVLLSFAITNNIGHIHGYLGNIPKAQQCFQHLLNILMWTIECHGRNILPPQLDGLLRNIQMFIYPNCNAPAA